MIFYVTHYFVGLVISFIGSLPPGVISLTVMHASVKKSIKHGLMVTAGASLLEFFQAFVAVYFSSFIAGNSTIQSIIHYSAAPVFALLGLSFLLKKSTPAGAAPQSSSSSSFVKGILVASVNLLVIPFWIFWSTYLAANNWIKLELISITILTTGIVSGTFLALGTYAWFGRLIKNKVEQIGHWIDRIVGGAFIAFAIYHAVKMLG